MRKEFKRGLETNRQEENEGIDHPENRREKSEIMTHLIRLKEAGELVLIYSDPESTGSCSAGFITRIFMKRSYWLISSIREDTMAMWSSRWQIFST